MIRVEPIGSIKLKGFNNLTKCLSFNLYDFCVARNEEERKAYHQYVYNKYRAEHVTKVLKGIVDIIEARVISISEQDFDPWGASAMVLMNDSAGGGSTAVDMHLDKSHVCAHTYPDIDEERQICAFRIDIDIATCGQISPLNALNFMLKAFDSDVVVIDYVVRGFTRTEDGKRLYIDHKMTSIQDFIEPALIKDYHCIDLALQSDKIWQTKMLRTNLNWRDYFLLPDKVGDQDRDAIMNRIKEEMRAVVHMWPS